MGNYLNPGNEKFRRMIQSEIYVDKTELIRYTNLLVNTLQEYVCVSRPRRFWKIYGGKYAGCLLQQRLRF